jgi:predicted transcriptional regulator
MGVREIARRIGRDVKGVHTDLSSLVSAGIVDRTGRGKYQFPSDQVKVRFELHAAARTSRTRSSQTAPGLTYERLNRRCFNARPDPEPRGP